MDEGVKTKQNNDEENKRKLEIMRKARGDMEKDKKKENEENYNKRKAEVESKPKADAGDDWMDNIKTYGTDA